MRANNILVIGLLGSFGKVLAATRDDVPKENVTELQALKLERPSLEVDPVRKPVRSTGCKVDLKFSATPGGESRRIKIGQDRYIRITLPQNYDHGRPAPLILAFHDKNMTAKDMESVTLLSSPAYNKEAVVVYPEAKIEDRWLSDVKPPPGANDIEFIGETIDKLAARLCVNEDRMYATGLGNGGGMVHLMACSRLSSRIAAFSLVNGNVLAGANQLKQGSVRDLSRHVWDDCVTYRSIVRLQAIHSENNTVFDYWGEIMDQKKPRRATVEHLVEWANRNKCGDGLAQPVPWRNSKDPIHKTLLQQGYIFEGFVEEGAAIKATYHCWPGDYGAFQQFDPELNEDGSMKDAPIVPKLDDPRTEEEKMEDLLHRLKRNMIQEHYYIRNTGHGWHRLEKVRDEADVKRKMEQGALGFAQPAPIWKQIPNPPDYDPETSFDEAVFSTFGHGYLEPPELERKPRFDTTARVLQFFRSYHLSDPAPKANRDAEGLTEPEAFTVKMFADQVGSALDDHDKANSDGFGALKARDHDDEIPVVDIGDFSAAAPGSIRKPEKDEL